MTIARRRKGKGVCRELMLWMLEVARGSHLYPILQEPAWPDEDTGQKGWGRRRPCSPKKTHFFPGCENSDWRKNCVLLPRWRPWAIWLVQCEKFSFEAMKAKWKQVKFLQVTENRGWGYCSYHCGLPGGVFHSTKLLETLVRWHKIIETCVQPKLLKKSLFKCQCSALPEVSEAVE